MAYIFPQRKVLLGVQTASASSSLEFTSLISSKFSTYFVKMEALVNSNGGSVTEMRFSTDNGSTYLSTNYAWNLFWNERGASGTISSASDSKIKVFEYIKAAVENYSDVMLYNLNSSTYSPICYSFSSYYCNASENQTEWGASSNSTTTAVNAIKFQPNVGTFTSGTISLYGVEEGGLIY